MLWTLFIEHTSGGLLTDGSGWVQDNQLSKSI